MVAMIGPGIPGATMAVRFWEKVDFTRGADGCWLWLGTVTKKGYGSFTVNGRPTSAHRLSYSMCRGPIPDGMDIDHLCRERACVNPTHLEAVSRRENILRGDGLSAQNARKTHCKRGHPLSGENLYLMPSKSPTAGPMRTCKECRRMRDRERRRT